LQERGTMTEDDIIAIFIGFNVPTRHR